MLPRPTNDLLQALVRMRVACPAEFELMLRYLNEAEQAILRDMRESNEDRTTRLMQGAARCLSGLADKFSNAHRHLTMRSDSGRESNQLPSFVNRPKPVKTARLEE